MMDKLEKEMKKNNGIAMPMFGALKYGVLKNASASADNVKADYREIYKKAFKKDPRELKKRMRSIES
jgi:hypothetical protein